MASRAESERSTSQVALRSNGVRDRSRTVMRAMRAMRAIVRRPETKKTTTEGGRGGTSGTPRRRAASGTLGVTMVARGRRASTTAAARAHVR